MKEFLFKLLLLAALIYFQPFISLLITVILSILIIII